MEMVLRLGCGVGELCAERAGKEPLHQRMRHAALPAMPLIVSAQSGKDVRQVRPGIAICEARAEIAAQRRILSSRLSDRRREPIKGGGDSVARRGTRARGSKVLGYARPVRRRHVGEQRFRCSAYPFGWNAIALKRLAGPRIVNQGHSIG
jgi:hypothetical protein